MKNTKVLALLLVAASTSAPAQSNVTLFGTVDMGYRWSDRNVDPRIGSQSRIDSGTSVPSRLGFQGVEDIGNGLKASFILEAAIDTSTGELPGGGGFSRQAFVALGGAFGKVALGRQYTPGYLFTSEVDPFGSVTVGQYNNVYLTEYRWNNQITYFSPEKEGLSFSAAYSLNGYGQESIGNRGNGTTGDVEALSIAPQYRRGSLLVGAHFQELHSRSTGRDDAGNVLTATYDGKKIRAYDVGATYDLGLAKLAALYGIRRSDSADFSPDTGASAVKDSRQWLLGATVPLGADGKLLASYVRRSSELAAGHGDAKAGQWALGYEHALSKRTVLYTTYASVNNNGVGRDAGFVSSVGAGYNPGNGYQRSAAVGIRHSF